MRAKFHPENEQIFEFKGDITYWEIATKIGVHKNTIMNWMQAKMSSRQKELLLNTIAEIKQEKHLEKDFEDTNVEDVIANLKDKYQENKRVDTVMKGVYWDSDVWDAIEKAANKIGPKMNSRFVNGVMRKYFQENGFLEK